MDFLYGLAANLLIKLLLDKHCVHKTEPPRTSSVQSLKMEAPQRIEIPEWVTNIPVNGFVGISGCCQSIEEARQQALESAVSQILQAMGAEYDLNHKSIISGNANHPRHELKESLFYTARWFIRSVQQNIKKSDIQQAQGKYICFVLVDFPPKMIDKLKRLTLGSKVSARVIKVNRAQIIVEVIENNGVLVSITDYEIMITTKNRHAQMITMFVWKVPEYTESTLKGIVFKKVSVQNGSRTFAIPNPIPAEESRNLQSLILGSQESIRILLHGYDEIGRPISLRVNHLQ